MSDMKQCPDCAEMVRAEARKCRYCGYRFDVGHRVESRRGFASLLGGLGGRQESLGPTELLAAWGVELGRHESSRLWCLARVSGRQGWLVLTEERILFFEMLGRNGARLVVEVPLAALQGLRPEGRESKLRLTGPGFDHLVEGLKTSDTEQIRVFLQDRAGGPPPTQPQSG